MAVEKSVLWRVTGTPSWDRAEARDQLPAGVRGSGHSSEAARPTAGDTTLLPGAQVLGRLHGPTGTGFPGEEGRGHWPQESPKVWPAASLHVRSPARQPLRL